MPVARKKPQNLLLCSNGILDEPSFLERAKPWITELFGLEHGKTKKILYVPFALNNPTRHGEEARQALLPLGIEVITARLEDDPVELLDQVEGIIVGGGNTYKLHEKLQRSNHLGEEIRKRVEAGMPYMGISAGAVLACPSIKTTSDPAPPTSSDHPYPGLRLVNFQIAPHYRDDAGENMWLLHHADNHNVPIIGLQNDTALRIRGNRVELLGTDKASFLQPDRQRMALAQQLRFMDSEELRDRLGALYENASSPPECETSVIQAALPRADKKRTR